MTYYIAGLTRGHRNAIKEMGGLVRGGNSAVWEEEDKSKVCEYANGLSQKWGQPVSVFEIDVSSTQISPWKHLGIMPKHSKMLIGDANVGREIYCTEGLAKTS